MRTGKIIAGFLACLMAVSYMPVSVLADDYVEETSDGSKSIPVTLNVSETYSVLLPAAFPLTYDSVNGVFEKEDTFKVKGTIPTTDYIEVSFPDSGLVTITCDTYSINGQITYGDASGAEASQYWLAATSVSKITASSPLSGKDYKTLKPVYDQTGSLKVSVPKPDVAGNYTGAATVKYEKLEIVPSSP